MMDGFQIYTKRAVNFNPLGRQKIQKKVTGTIPMKIKGDTFTPIKAGGGALSTPLDQTKLSKDSYICLFLNTLSTREGEWGIFFLRLFGLIAQK